MTGRRCPSCGGLVGADAEWCTQCFARLDPEPEPAVLEEISRAEGSQAPEGAGAPAEGRQAAGIRPAPTNEGAPVRVTGESIVWECPACGTENPIEARACSACGTPFGQVFEDPDQKPQVDPGRAATASLFFPGAGHVIAGRRGEGFARAIVFAFALVLGVASLGPVRAGSGGTYLALMVLSLGAATTLYVTSTADAGRVARGEDQILSMRMLLYGAVGLIFAAIVLLTFTAIQARG